MKIVKETEKITFQPTESTTIHEFDTQVEAISGAIAEINGRYPETGFALNQHSKELVYVVSGSGTIITPHEENEIAAGDVIYIDNQEQFAWLGNLVLFMATTPKFDPVQHIVVDAT